MKNYELPGRSEPCVSNSVQELELLIPEKKNPPVMNGGS